MSENSAWDIEQVIKENTIKILFPRPIKTSYKALEKFKVAYNIQDIYLETNFFGDTLIALKF